MWLPYTSPWQLGHKCTIFTTVSVPARVLQWHSWLRTSSHAQAYKHETQWSSAVKSTQIRRNKFLASCLCWYKSSFNKWLSAGTQQYLLTFHQWWQCSRFSQEILDLAAEYSPLQHSPEIQRPFPLLPDKYYTLMSNQMVLFCLHKKAGTTSLSSVYPSVCLMVAITFQCVCLLQQATPIFLGTLLFALVSPCLHFNYAIWTILNVAFITEKQMFLKNVLRYKWLFQCIICFWNFASLQPFVLTEIHRMLEVQFVGNT